MIENLTNALNDFIPDVEIDNSELVLAGILGILLGLISIIISPTLMVILIVGCGLGYASLKRPEIALLGILAATSSIVFEEKLPLVPIGFGSLHVSDVILVGLFVLIFLRWWVERDFKLIGTPLDTLLLAFFTIAVLATVIAIFQASLHVETARRALRVVAYYLCFFLVTNLVRQDRQLHLLVNGMTLLGTVVAVAMIAQYTLGVSIFVLPGRVETLATQGTTYAGVTRILPPGQSLVIVSFIISLATLIIDERRRYQVLNFIQLALLGTAIVMTFNRSFWVMVVIAVIALTYVAKAEYRRRLIILGLIVLILATFLLLYAFIEPETKIIQLGTAFIDRLITLGRASTLQEGSLSWRYVENEYVLPALRSNPFFGIGLGSEYRPFDPRLDYIGVESTLLGYIHNGHFWILVKTGVLGYLSLAAFSVVFLIRSFKHWQHIPNPQMQGYVIGIAVMYVGVIAANIVNPMFMQWFWTGLLGMVFGINEVALRRVPRNS